MELTCHVLSPFTGEGWYLLREITGLPELVDEEYPAALKELEGIIGLTMPVLERLGE